MLRPRSTDADVRIKPSSTEAAAIRDAVVQALADALVAAWRRDHAGARGYTSERA